MNPTKMAFQEADSVLCQTYNVFADPEALFEATKFDARHSNIEMA